MTVQKLVYVVDDDADFAASLTRLLRRSGYHAEPFTDPGGLIEAYASAPADCVVSDVMMGETDGFAFARQLRAMDDCVGIVFITGWPSTSKAVEAVRQLGAINYLEKPIDEQSLLAAVEEAASIGARCRAARARLTNLTGRESQVLGLLVRGFSTKEIARELDISPRTVEDHRAQIMAKTGARSLAAMIDLTRPAG